MEQKERIKKEAIRLFEAQGYYGTTVRQISQAAKCSLPMMYYYYQSKETLFAEIVYTDFMAVLAQLNKAISPDTPPVEYYTRMIGWLSDLPDRDRAIYKLAIKVYLGFEGDIPIRREIIKWEDSILIRHETMLKAHYPDREDLPIVTRLLIRTLEHMIEEIIVLGNIIPEEQVRDQITHILG